MEAIRVLVADDHTLFRDGLRALFSSLSEFEFVGEAATGVDADPPNVPILSGVPLASILPISPVDLRVTSPKSSMLANVPRRLCRSEFQRWIEARSASSD